MAKNKTGKDQVFDSDSSAVSTSIVEYPESFQGIIYSYVDRVPYSENMVKTMIAEWNKYKNYLKVEPVAVAKTLAQAGPVHKLTAPS